MARKDRRETHLRYQIPPSAEFLFATPRWDRRQKEYIWIMRVTPCGMNFAVPYEKIPLEDFLEMQKSLRTSTTPRLVTCKVCRQHIGQSSAKKIR